MSNERIKSIIEELAEVQTMAELKAVWCHWQAEHQDAANAPQITAALKEAVRRLRQVPVKEEKPPQEELAGLLSQLAALKAKLPAASRPPVVRGTRSYRLLKKEVTWCDIPQVKAIMEIVGAHMEVGDVREESEIVQMLEANPQVLQTRQGARKIFDYYRGNHAKGLEAHGNIEKV
jgi:hypothetical protein